MKAALSARAVHTGSMLAENINAQQSRSGSRDCGHHVGTDVLPGRDQPTELMRDFNRMAEPIEGLVDSQSQWSLWELVEQVAHDAEYKTPARGCRVTATADAADNVVRNSTRYTAEGTTVEVRLERQQAANRHEIVVRVLDSGPGVPDEALPNIFELFYRLDDARNRTNRGSGSGPVDRGPGHQAAWWPTSCIQPQRGWVSG